MLSNRKIKLQARSRLSSHWPLFAIITLIVFVLTFIINYIFARKNIIITNIIAFFVIILMNFLSKIAFNLSIEEEITLENSIFDLRSFVKMCNYSIMIILLYNILNFMVGIAAKGSDFAGFISSNHFVHEGILYIIAKTGGIPDILFNIFLLIIYFIMASYIFCSIVLYKYVVFSQYDQIGPTNTIRFTLKLVKDYKWRLFSLIISFTGWFILSIFTFGIGLVLLVPYIKVSIAVFYSQLLKEKKDLLAKLVHK